MGLTPKIQPLKLSQWLSAGAPLQPSSRSFSQPSGKLTKNYGKSPFSMGKSTISMAIFRG
jgi:hypothetical protein